MFRACSEQTGKNDVKSMLGTKCLEQSGKRLMLRACSEQSGERLMSRAFSEQTGENDVKSMLRTNWWKVDVKSMLRTNWWKVDVKKVLRTNWWKVNVKSVPRTNSFTTCHDNRSVCHAVEANRWMSTALLVKGWCHEHAQNKLFHHLLWELLGLSYSGGKNHRMSTAPTGERLMARVRSEQRYTSAVWWNLIFFCRISRQRDLCDGVVWMLKRLPYTAWMPLTKL